MNIELVKKNQRISSKIPVFFRGWGLGGLKAPMANETIKKEKKKKRKFIS